MQNKDIYYKPHGQEERINKYIDYNKLFFGKNDEVFDFQKSQSSNALYIVNNFTRLVSEFFSDLLFSEPPQYLSENQEELDEFIKFNKLNTLNLESSVVSSFRGDAIYKLRKDENDNVIVEDVPAMMYFPQFAEDNINEVISVTIAWIMEDNYENRYVFKEIHYPDRIENKLFWLKDQTNRQGEFTGVNEIEVPLEKLGIDKPEVMENPVGEILIVHIPNYKIGSTHFGISDIQSLESLLNEADFRMTKLANILDKHSDPKLAVPAGVLNEYGQIQTGNFDMFEVSSSEGGVNKPEYITWDAKVEAVMQEIELVADRLSMFSRMPAAIINQDERSSIPEAAKALKLKFLMALKKAERKKVYYDTGLKKVFDLAGKLQGKEGLWDDVQIIWNDGLPEDPIEELQVKVFEKQLGIKSTERIAREQLSKQGLEEEEIEDEITAIKADADISVPNDTRPARVTLRSKTLIE